jgi:hypothetical protein
VKGICDPLIEPVIAVFANIPFTDAFGMALEKAKEAFEAEEALTQADRKKLKRAFAAWKAGRR